MFDRSRPIQPAAGSQPGWPGPPWAFHLHLGRTGNRTVSDERRQINHYSVAVARKIGDRLQLVADISQETNPDKGSNTANRSALFGAIYSVSKDSTSTSVTAMVSATVPPTMPCCWA